MSVWDTYPEEYRKKEVQAILLAARAGESVQLVGLSGAGKSNLLGFLKNRWPLSSENDDLHLELIDCNRLEELNTRALFSAIHKVLASKSEQKISLTSLNQIVTETLDREQKILCLMLDRFEILQQTEDHTYSTTSVPYEMPTNIGWCS